MEKKLIHVFTEGHREKILEPSGNGLYRIVDSWEVITVNGVFDDGTWEPLFKYKFNYSDCLPRINVRHAKGAFGKTRSEAVEAVKALVKKESRRSAELLID